MSGKCGPKVPECEGFSPGGAQSGCEPGAGNAPIDYVFNAAMAQAVDMGRRAAIEAGAHGYQVSLIWVKRDHRQVYQEVKRIDLMPARVDSPAEVAWSNSEAGGHADGALVLSWVSLSQVSDKDLMGQLDGKDPPDGVDFFVEVTRHKRCEGDSVTPQRYTPASLPEFDTVDYQWRMSIHDQHHPRTEHGEDQTIKKTPYRKKAQLRV
jgi:hypothetical protein